MTSHPRLLSLAVCVAAMCHACDASDGAGPSETPPAEIAAELGMDRYRGKIEPVAVETNGDEVVYSFDGTDGPLCMRGDPYFVSVRDVGAEDVVIFLQGGGACWSAFCLAVTKATQGVVPVDVLDPALPANPVRGWNAVYLPYCDGSFFAGDADIDDDLNGKGTRYHRGLANLTGALEIAKAHFPAPRRVLLAGSSGGAYGLLAGAPLARAYFPDAEFLLMADSGFGLARAGDPGFLQLVIDELNMASLVPDDCERCVTSGHLSPLVAWWLERDPNVRVATFSSWYDTILGDVFLQVSGAQWADALAAESDLLHDAFPDRARRFIVDGVQHTSLLGDASGIIGEDLTAVELPPDALADLLGGGLVIGGLETTEQDGVTMAAWLSAMIEGDLDNWRDIVGPRGAAPY